jgi:hypothetical protein
MPTVPEEPEQPQKGVRRAAAAIVAPVSSTTPRIAALLVMAGGAGSLAPEPFGVLSASAAIGAAFYIGRKMR